MIDFSRYSKPALVERLTAIRFDICYHRAVGSSLFYRDDSGREIEVLDMVGGFGAALFGHNHPALLRVAKSVLEAERPFHVQGSMRQAAGHLAREISDRIGAFTGREYMVTLANTGTEAVEAAIKHAEMERQARCPTLRDRPPQLWALEGAFHGKTTGTLALTMSAEYQRHFPHGITAVALPWSDPDMVQVALEAAIVDGVANVAACFVEPIQGEGGVRVVSDQMLAALRAAADRGGFPLVIDEIQCGMARTGTFLASEQSGVVGDYYVLAKSLGGGLAKISALAVDRSRYQHDFGYLHSSTYSDDDYSSEIALAALELLGRDGEAIAMMCREKGRYLLDALTALAREYPDQIAGVRGRGLMIGVELSPAQGSESALLRVLGQQDQLASFVAGALLHEHRIRVLPTLSAKSTLRLEPPAFVERSELDRTVSALRWVCDVLRDADAYRLARYSVGREGIDATWERRPARTGRRAADSAARVGFLAHFLSPAELRDWEPGLGPLSDAECAAFLDRSAGIIDPFEVGTTVLRSAGGTEAEIRVFGVPFLPEQVITAMRTGDDGWARSMVATGLSLAQDAGCSVVGFGGYTSIVTNNCLAVDGGEVAVTSGNSLTAAAGLEAMLSAARRLALSPLTLGILGAAGNIGAILAELAAPEVDRIVLIGRARTRRRLDDLARRLGGIVEVQVATEVAALIDCNVILTATNAPAPVVSPEHLSLDPLVIADIAVPGDVDRRVLVERPRALVLHGGIVRAPLNQTIDIDGMSLAPGQLYGCLAEAAILGLAGVTGDFSRGPLEADKVRRIRELAREHGFSVEEDAVMP